MVLKKQEKNKGRVRVTSTVAFADLFSFPVPFVPVCLEHRIGFDLEAFQFHGKIVFTTEFVGI